MLFLRVGLAVSLAVSLSFLKANADEPICYAVKKDRTTTHVEKVNCMDASKYKSSHIKKFRSAKEFSMAVLLSLADETEQTTDTTPAPFVQTKLREQCSAVSTRQNRRQPDHARTTVDSLHTSTNVATSMQGSQPMTSSTSGDVMSQTVSSDLPRSEQTSHYPTNTDNVSSKSKSMTSQSSSHHMTSSSFQDGTTPLPDLPWSEQTSHYTTNSDNVMTSQSSSHHMTSSSFQDGTTPLPVCKMPIDKGTCRGLQTRFGFEDGACRQFYYSTCEGNANNFMTVEECMETCQNGSLINGTETPATTKKPYTDYAFKVNETFSAPAQQCDKVQMTLYVSSDVNQTVWVYFPQGNISDQSTTVEAGEGKFYPFFLEDVSNATALLEAVVATETDAYHFWNLPFCR